MKEKNYRREDFVADSYFRQWVISPDDASSTYWQLFLDQHPEQRETVRQATDLVHKLSEVTTRLAGPANRSEEDAIWQAIQREIVQNQEAPLTHEPVIRPVWSRFGRVAAASVAVVAGLSWWLLYPTTAPLQKTRTHQSATSRPLQLVEKINTTQQPVFVVLTDGSSVILQKNSRLRYDKTLSGNRREITLEGEAYFDVAKDPHKPFIVYANDLVTKVLGTSFNVRAYAGAKDVVVTVRSGRVAVFPQADITRAPEQLTSDKLTGMVLSPNEQAVFNRTDARLVQTRPNETADARALAFQPVSFDYQAVPVREVFKDIEKSYGLPVVFSNQAVGNCRLTADLREGTLAQKLDIICASVEANWDIQATQIVVSGRGCHP
ncbi:FecR family protein [Arsenicibacter rosenii]|uniref:Uncharacterized protein n=1 Tax=Arsenicibacter rosenii TaxID=1750698 RepID=A0A1S2VHN5_9BACT|nr:FecR family protein [Arsenicibacter rosenii]OIN58261.1 hypothetical protein BLX24_14750 [Arsenicibacter rosenii]